MGGGAENHAKKEPNPRKDQLSGILDAFNF